MSLTILAINGSLTPAPSKSRALLDIALEGVLTESPSARAHVLELRDYRIDFADGRPYDAYSQDTRRALDLVASADAYLVATPVYRGSYTGALKNFIDLIPADRNGEDPLRGKVVGLIASGGSLRHSLVIEHQLRPLFAFFGSHVPALGVYASREHFDQAGRPTGRVAGELHDLGRDVVALTQYLGAHPRERFDVSVGIEA
jgi:MsuE subfamily FMN reductase